VWLYSFSGSQLTETDDLHEKLLLRIEGDQTEHETAELVASYERDEQSRIVEDVLERGWPRRSGPERAARHVPRRAHAMAAKLRFPVPRDALPT